MPVFHVPDPDATITVEILGLAVCCFNAAYTDASGRIGRWEVAFPRPNDHGLTIEFPKLGILAVPPAAALMEFKDRTGIVVDNPKHEPGTFVRRSSPTASNKNDYRWLTDFTNRSEIPHSSPPVKVPPGGKRPSVTKLFIYDATFYSEIDDPPIRMVLPLHDNTGLIKENGKIIPAPEFLAGPVLDNPANDFGFVARSIRIDIHRPAATGIVDISIDNESLTTIRQDMEPRSIKINNMERPNTTTPGGGTIKTATSEYGRGDFFRYYEFFSVPDASPKFHLWSKKERPGEAAIVGGASSKGEDARTGDCNGVRVDAFTDLNGL